MSGRPFVVTAGMVITDFSSDPIPDGAVVIDDGIIQEVGRRADYTDDLPTLKYPSDFLMPGLIDTHAHLEFCVAEEDDTVIAAYQKERQEGVLAARALDNAQTLLRSGVTTVRDCASSLTLLGVRRLITEGIAGPRVLVCGPPITTTAGHLAWVADPVDSAVEVRTRVRQQIAAGVDAIKIVSSGGTMTAGSNPHRPQFSSEELRAAVEEAHRLGRRVIAHSLNTEAMRRCVEAGVDSIDHARWNGPDGARSIDSAVIDSIIEAGTNIGMTASGWTRKLLRSESGRNELHEAFAVHRELRDRGAFLTLHTDAGSTETDFESVVDSLQVMVEALGASPAEAMRAMTSDAARVLGLEQEIGALARGAHADFIVLRGDPRDDLEFLRAPIAVAKAGAIVDTRGHGG